MMWTKPKLCFFTLILAITFHHGFAQDLQVFKRIRECLGRDYAMVCLKEEALEILNRTVRSDRPINVYDYLDIVKDSNFISNRVEEDLPKDVNQRSARLNDLLYDKVEELFQSRSVKLNLASAFEGRGKKGKKGMGGMLMMGGLAMAGMMAQLFMGKIALLAGAALMIAKIALMLSAITGLKKLAGGGGEKQHVVYTTSGDSGHSHGGGGGWYRSLNTADGNQELAYKAHVPNDMY